MTATALSGPYIAFGNTPGQSPDNPNAGASLFFGGAGILDPRYFWTYKPGQGALRTTAGWLGSSAILSLNVVPYTKAVAAIAAAANVVANTPMTLVSANSATTGVSIVSSVVNSLTGVADTNSGAGLVGIDTFTSCTASVSGNVLTVTAVSNSTLSIGQTILTQGGTIVGTTPVGMKIIGLGTGTGGAGTYYLSGTAGTATSATTTLQTAGPIASLIPFGSISSSVTGTPSLWNPQALLGRAVAITAAASASGAVVFTIKGYDIYGYPMIETITAATNTQTLGKKAFKYIKSVTPDSSDAINYSVDTTDIIGFPIRTDFFGDSLVNYSASLNPAVITANTGYVASVQTAPTATTGDVRGTYALQTAASTNANRIMIKQSPPPYNVVSDIGLYGATQFSTGF